MTKLLVTLAGCCALAAGAMVLAQSAAKPTAAKPAPVKPVENLKIPYPEWLFPIDPDSLHPPKGPVKEAPKVQPKGKAKETPKEPPQEPPKAEDVELLTVPDSDQKYTLAGINDHFNAPDWHPADHIPMPDIVAKGRKPDIIACAFCHSPTGQGRPENAPLAGLPEAYIKEQLESFGSGQRAPVGPEAWKPSQVMHALSATLKDEEIDASAKYFAQQKLKRRQYVIESVNIPRAEPSDWVYKEVGGTEDLENRLLEVAPDITRHQHRDDQMQYTAYVPPGALARGKLLVTTGDKGKTQACATCHLAGLKGTDRIPPISGRSPTYLLRQLIAFKNGTRGGEAAAQMNPVVDKLELDDMIALAAYVGSLYPQ